MSSMSMSSSSPSGTCNSCHQMSSNEWDLPAASKDVNGVPVAEHHPAFAQLHKFPVKDKNTIRHLFLQNLRSRLWFGFGQHHGCAANQPSQPQPYCFDDSIEAAINLLLSEFKQTRVPLKKKHESMGCGQEIKVRVSDCWTFGRTKVEASKH